MDNSRLLGGRYDIKRHLQTGHVTLVYEGFDRQREQEVAIEVMRDVRGQDPAAAARLKAAGRAAAALRHPNIAEVQAAEETGGLAYIVRERPSGGSLGELITRDGRLPAADAATIALQISEGLTYAHRRDVVHGGLTPSLVLLTEDRSVKLSGFGVAATVLTSDALDTRYAAPEQFQGAPGDARSDIYALGSCLYEMLLGLPPFAGDPQMLARIGPRVPPELGAILRQLLAADPGDRYEDAADVCAALSRYLGIVDVRHDAAPPRASIADRPERSGRTDVGDVGRRSLNRPVLATAAVVSVVVLATAAFTARQLTRESEMVADTGGSGDGDVEIGAEQEGTVGQSASDETPGSTSTSTESTTTDPSTTTTTDPEEDDETDEDEDETEEPEDPGHGGPTTTPTTSPATTTAPTSPSTTAAPATVPNVVGMGENQASGTLAAQGLGMSTRRVTVSDSRLDGRVLSQSPGGGSPHPASGVVNVDVGRYCFLIC